MPRANGEGQVQVRGSKHCNTGEQFRQKPAKKARLNCVAAASRAGAEISVSRTVKGLNLCLNLDTIEQIQKRPPLLHSSLAIFTQTQVHAAARASQETDQQAPQTILPAADLV